MRTEILLGGVNPGKLFSPRDITLRGLLSKRKVAEGLQLKAQIAASCGDIDLVKSTFSEYVDATWYSKVKESRSERMFKEYYTQYKHLTPELVVGADGKPTVRGLT